MGFPIIGKKFQIAGHLPLARKKDEADQRTGPRSHNPFPFKLRRTQEAPVSGGLAPRSALLGPTSVCASLASVAAMLHPEWPPAASTLGDPHSPKGRLAIGQEVAKEVDRIYEASKFRACNRIAGNADLAAESERMANAYAEADKVFHQYTNVSRATELARAAQGHNCYTLSLLALDILKARGVESRMVSTVAHACVAIGPMPKGRLPDDMRDWPSDISIVDPWSDNIVCPAATYADHFAKTMASWHQRGDRIVDADGHKISPIDEKWSNEVLRGPRVISDGSLWSDGH